MWNLSFLAEQKKIDKSGLVFEKEIQNKNKNNLGLGKKSGPRPTAGAASPAAEEPAATAGAASLEEPTAGAGAGAAPGACTSLEGLAAPRGGHMCQ